MNKHVYAMHDFIHRYPACAQRYHLEEKGENTGVLYIAAYTQMRAPLFFAEPIHQRYDQIIVLVDDYAYACIDALWYSTNMVVTYTLVTGCHAQLLFNVGIIRAVQAQYKINVPAYSSDVNVQVRLVYIARATDHVDIECVQHHTAANSSEVICHGVAMHQARVLYQGNVMIDPLVEGKACAQQTHAALVMSDQVRITSTPSLEIATKQVQCKHATAISHCDRQYLWYMQSRGIGLSDVRYLIAEGFCNQLFRHHDNSSLTHAVARELLASLQGTLT